MTFEEKTTWVTAIVTLIVPVAYFALILRQLQVVPAEQIAYQKPMLIAIGTSIVLTIVGSILVAIGSAVSAEIRQEGSAKSMDRTDERDVFIGRRGEIVGYYVASAGAVVVLGMTMLQYPYFWIANILYLSFALATVVSSAVKLVAYRRGF